MEFVYLETDDMWNCIVGETPIEVIKDYVAAGSITTLYGYPEAGKTFAAIDMTFAVAMGTKWCGSPVKIPGNTAMFFLEGNQEKLNRRYQAYINYYNINRDEINNRMLWLNPSQFFQLPKDIDRLERIIDKNELRLCIIDTLSTIFTGKENDLEDMGKIINPLDQLATRYNCAIVLIHHTPKIDNGLPRGNAALIAKSRTMIYMKKDEKTGKGELSQRKNNENPKPDEIIHYEIADRYIRTNSEGEEIHAGVFTYEPTLKERMEQFKDRYKYTRVDFENHWGNGTTPCPKSTVNRKLKPLKNNGIITPFGEYLLSTVPIEEL